METTEHGKDYYDPKQNPHVIHTVGILSPVHYINEKHYCGFVSDGKHYQSKLVLAYKSLQK